jgi:hypothetical protein
MFEFDLQSARPCICEGRKGVKKHERIRKPMSRESKN